MKCISSQFSETGWCVCFQKFWNTENKKVLYEEGELLTGLCLFLQLLPPPVTLESYRSAVEENLFPLFWQISLLLECLVCFMCSFWCFLVAMLIAPSQSICHLLFTFISMLSLPSILSVAFLCIDTLLVSQPCSSLSFSIFNAQKGVRIWV